MTVPLARTETDSHAPVCRSHASTTQLGGAFPLTFQFFTRAVDPSRMDVMQTALSGLTSAETRVAASAHNVANLSTADFHPLEARQVSRPGGGSEVFVSESPEARPVDLAREVIGQIEASTQYTASLRVLAVGADLRGSLVDLFA